MKMNERCGWEMQESHGQLGHNFVECVMPYETLLYRSCDVEQRNMVSVKPEGYVGVHGQSTSLRDTASHGTTEKEVEDQRSDLDQG